MLFRSMEVGFQAIVYFLGIQDMSGRSGVDQIRKNWLWWEQPQSDAAYQIVRRHIQNELEGQSKVSIIGGMKKPDVIEINPVVEADLLLNWQELLIRMIANAFDMSAMSLGVEHDVNRAVGTVLNDKDFRSAIVPIAKRLEEAFTRKILHDKLGWRDLAFKFLRLDDPDIETLAALLSRMYSANANTPNEFRKKMGWEKLDSPFADLTQAEMMLVNQEAAIKLQQQMQTSMMQQQLSMQQQSAGPGQDQSEQPDESFQDNTMPPMQQKQAGSSGGGSQKPGQNVPTVQAPKPMTLPKFPIAGSAYNARQIATMPTNHLSQLIINGELPPARELLTQMQEQEPGILEQMTEELQQFFEDALEEEEREQAEQKGASPATVKQWQKQQAKRVKDQLNRINDFAVWLSRYGQQQGKPGGGSAKGGLAELDRGRGGAGTNGRNKRQVMRPVGGKPGSLNLNPITFSSDKKHRSDS